MSVLLAVTGILVIATGALLFGRQLRRHRARSRNLLIAGLAQTLRRLAARREPEAQSYREALPRIAELNQAFDAMLRRDDYFRHSDYLTWRGEAEGITGNLCRRSANLDLAAEEANEVEILFKRLEDARPEIDHRNDEYVGSERARYAELLASIAAELGLEDSLTDHQQIAILHDEDRTLVIAGAGTGKTTTLTAKARFLIRSGMADPAELLVLSFGKDVAKELQRGLASLAVEARTFHKLGRDIMKQAGKQRLRPSSLAEDNKKLTRFIEEKLKDILRDEKNQALRNLLLYDLVPERLWVECKTKEEYWDYIRAHKPRALRDGEKVRSFEEARIANFLFSNTVEYEYERPYEHSTIAPGRPEYRPDFYLPKHRIYIEHFGVDRNGIPRFLPKHEARRYQQDMKWKRKLHQKHGTTLVETHSWEAKEGVLERNLAERLEAKGASLKPRSVEEMLKHFNNSGRVSRLARLMGSFLNLFKEGEHDLPKLRSAQCPGNPRRVEAFLTVFEMVLDAYEARLDEESGIDFHDMISKGRRVVEDDGLHLGYRFILVDEFQDLSPAKVRFLQVLLRRASGARLFCVGDDWQSIYRFLGSDVTAMTRFEDQIGFCKQLVLPDTFRFGEHIEEVSSQFILKNPIQIQKRLQCGAVGRRPAVHLLLESASEGECGDRSALLRAIEMIARRTGGKKSKVFVLERYHSNIDSRRKQIRELWRAHPTLDIQLSTVHSRKGLAADYVIVDNVVYASNGYGFPCEVSGDPLIDLLLVHSEVFPHAEERRVFYVALTRAREEVFIISHHERPSEFVRELISEPGAVNQVDTLVESIRPRCPQCSVGCLESKTCRYGGFMECDLCGWRKKES